MKEGVEHATRLAWSAHGSVRLSNAKAAQNAYLALWCAVTMAVTCCARARDVWARAELCCYAMMMLNDTGRLKVSRIVWRSLNDTSFAKNTYEPRPDSCQSREMS